MKEDRGMANWHGIVDIHAHILPGIDDGARDMEEAESMLCSALDQGIRAAVATPHYSRTGTTDRERLADLAAALQERMRMRDPQFTIYLGQETYYHEELPGRLREGQALTLAGGRHVLVEFDPSVTYQSMFRAMRRLIGSGYVPVLAHMERYQCLRKEGRVRELIGCGCFMQMNYDSLRGPWLRPDVRWCRKQVLEGRVHVLGTDMHRIDFRPPRIKDALRWLKDSVEPGRFDALTSLNALSMLEGGMGRSIKGDGRTNTGITITGITEDGQGTDSTEFRRR